MKASSALVRWLSGRILPPLAYPVVRGPLRGKRFILRSAAGEGGGASVNGVEPRKTRALIEILLGAHSPALRTACTDFLLRLAYPLPSICEEVPGDTELLFIPAGRRRQPAALASDA